MRKTLLFFLTLVLPFALTSRAQDGALIPRALPPITWEASPTSDDMVRHYPEAARAANQDGNALMDCLALSTRSLECRVIREWPSEAGFGAAALSMVDRFRAPTVVDGQSTIGGRALVPMFFTSPGPHEPTPLPVSVSLGGSLIANPVWLAHPTEAQVAAAYPQQHLVSGRRFSVTLECIVGLYGLLHCSPTQTGTDLEMLNAAARSLAQYYRMAELDADGKSTLGRTIYLYLYPPPRR